MSSSSIQSQGKNNFHNVKQAKSLLTILSLPNKFTKNKLQNPKSNKNHQITNFSQLNNKTKSYPHYTNHNIIYINLLKRKIKTTKKQKNQNISQENQIGELPPHPSHPKIIPKTLRQKRIRYKRQQRSFRWITISRVSVSRSETRVKEERERDGDDDS